MVDTESNTFYDEKEGANCLTIEKKTDPNQEYNFAFRSSECEEKVAYPICMIVKDEVENETTTLSSTSTTESTSTNDSASKEELATIDCFLYKSSCYS